MGSGRYNLYRICEIYRKSSISFFVSSKNTCAHKNLNSIGRVKLLSNCIKYFMMLYIKCFHCKRHFYVISIKILILISLAFVVLNLAVLLYCIWIEYSFLSDMNCDYEKHSTPLLPGYVVRSWCLVFTCACYRIINTYYKVLWWIQ